MQIFDRRDPLFRFHVLGDEFHRAGTVKRDQRDNVVELLYVELLRQTRHSAGLHLEKTDRFAAVIESKRSGIVEWNILQRKVWLALVNQGQRILNDGQRFQSEEIHFQEAQIIERSHGVLADHVVAFHVATKRDVIRQVAIRDHHSRGVHTGIARQAFENFRVIKQLPGRRLGGDRSFQFRIFFHG